MKLILLIWSVAPLLLAQPPKTALEPEWYLPTGNGCRLYVQELGKGEDTIIVLHGGFGAEHSYLLDPFQDLPTRYRVVFYDQRASLRSPCPETSISVEKHLADLERLRAELAVPKVTIVGHSMGSYLAMAYLAEHPDRICRLILLGAISPKKAATPEEIALQEHSDEGARPFLKRQGIEAQRKMEGLDKPSEQMSAKDVPTVGELGLRPRIRITSSGGGRSEGGRSITTRRAEWQHRKPCLRHGISFQLLPPTLAPYLSFSAIMISSISAVAYGGTGWSPCLMSTST
jgi:pimeloyl-ACP methyl ester carboxylesterase